MPPTTIVAVGGEGSRQARKRKRTKAESKGGRAKSEKHKGGELSRYERDMAKNGIDIAAEIKAVNEVPTISETFKVLDVIGSGTFSTVYKARIRTKDEMVALKRIIPNCRAKFIDREVACLHKLNGEHNVAALYTILSYEDTHVLVLEYFDHEIFSAYFRDIALDQVQAYMGALLQALAHVHKHHIVHRDVKPANFLHSRRSKRFLLVDFGLAQETTETGITDRPPRKPPQTKLDRQAPAHVLHTYGKPFRYGCGAKDGGAGKSDRRREQDTQRAGTRGFRAPEVLLRSPIQTPAIDVWSAGVVMLSILSGTSPFFLSNRDVDGLIEIANVCGITRVSALAKFYGKDFQTGTKLAVDDVTGSATELQGLCEMAYPDHPSHTPGQGALSKSVYSLLEELLSVEPHRRITAEDALRHPFFTGGVQSRALSYTPHVAQRKKKI
eukprot:m.35233 g.35233  ORF g.35233 m.35233 type:complete len:440 (-) comp12749_c0_seq2:1665-2984(-)